MRKQIALLLLSLFPFYAHGALSIPGHVADGEVNSSSGGSVGNIVNGNSLIGTWTGNHVVEAVIPFLLPDLNPGESFSSATLGIVRQNVWGNGSDVGTSGTVPFAVDLYGLARMDVAPDLIAGDYNGTASLIQSGLLPSGLAYSTTAAAYTSDDLSTWLNSQYDGGNNAGQYVFLSFRASEIDTSQLTDRTGVQIYSQNATNEAQRPLISYELVPEPSAVTLLGLSMTGLFIRRRR